MDEDTFIAIRALHHHHAAFDFKFVGHDDDDGDLSSLLLRHPPVESNYRDDAYYATAAAIEYVDADVVAVGDESQQQQQEHHPSIESNYHDASSSSYNDIKYRIEASSLADLHLQRVIAAATPSSCTLSDKNAVLIAAIMALLVYPLTVTRLRSKWWVNRKARSMISEESTATSAAHDAQDMLERGLFIDDDDV